MVRSKISDDNSNYLLPLYEKYKYMPLYEKSGSPVTWSSKSRPIDFFVIFYLPVKVANIPNIRPYY